MKRQPIDHKGGKHEYKRNHLMVDGGSVSAALCRTAALLRHAVPLLCCATALLVLIRRPDGWSALVGLGAVLTPIPAMMLLIRGPRPRLSELPFPERVADLLLMRGPDYGYLLFSIGLLGLIWDHLPRRQAGDPS
ncbi:hypothetical protein [Leeia sp.]|uniref:hypothetical protein n=1 Tax=Leeia sp. TaxID=2884678 RepID=UPI0035B4A173